MENPAGPRQGRGPFPAVIYIHGGGWSGGNKGQFHDAMGGIECRSGKQILTKLDFHSFWLATRRDALYTEAGAVVVRNPAVGSAHVGNEIDLQVAWRASEHWQFAFGVAHMFPGQYLKESTGSSGVTAP